MDGLMSQFTLLSDQALRDRSFDPSKIEDLMQKVEGEVYKSWTAAKCESQDEESKAKAALEEAKAALDSAMERAMGEFRQFEAEGNRILKEQRNKRTRTTGNQMQKAATVASKKYVKAAINSATTSMRSAPKGLSNRKVHPYQEAQA